MKIQATAAALLLVTAAIYPCAGQTVAYGDPVYGGNQAFNGNLGLDFSVNLPIVVTSLGAFNSNAPNGFAGTIQVGIFTNPGGVQVGPTATLTGTNGTLVNGDRFITLSPVFVLLPGNYSVVAVGFGSGDTNGNATIAGFQPSTENTGGLITFTGNGRFDSNTTLDFPPTCSGCPVSPTNLFNAGTFKFEAVAAPVLTKAFGGATLTAGGTTSLTFTLTNPNPAGATLTGLTFGDNLPSNLAVATPNGLTNSCGGGVVAIAGSNSIGFSGGSLAGGASCTFSVNVTTPLALSSLGVKTNTTSTVEANETFPGSPASASVTVTAYPYLASSWWYWYVL